MWIAAPQTLLLCACRHPRDGVPPAHRHMRAAIRRRIYCTITAADTHRAGMLASLKVQRFLYACVSRQVRERLAACGIDSHALTAATFHSFCFMLLRRYHVVRLRDVLGRAMCKCESWARDWVLPCAMQHSCTTTPKLDGHALSHMQAAGYAKCPVVWTDAEVKTAVNMAAR